MPRGLSEKKTCIACGDEMPIEAFRFADKERKRRDNRCSECQMLWARYRITKYDFERILSDQNHKCAICDDPINKTNAHVDHCHNEGHIRALLCSYCNRGLGFFKDNPKILEKATYFLRNSIAYIKHI